MMKILILLLGIVMFGCQERNNYKDEKYEIGQIWEYQTRVGEENSTLTIVGIEENQKLGVIISVFVDNLKINNPTAPGQISNEIQHMPFSKEAINKSVGKLKGKATIMPNFKEGYDQWKKAYTTGKAGIFTIPVKEAVQYMEEAIRNGQ